MTYVRRNVLASVALAAGILALSSHSAHAMTLVPPSLEFAGDKGATLKTEVKLYNETNQEVTVYPTTSNFTAGDEDGTPKFDGSDNTTDLASWISVDKTSYTLGSNEKITIPVTISIPANADPGGHYAALFFGNAPAAVNGSGVAVESKLGTLVILQVAGDIREAGSVAELVAEKHGLNRLPIDFKLRIQNSGNVHFRPKGFVTIRNMWGGVSAQLPINTKEGAVLPNSFRSFEMTWNRNNASDKKGNFFQEVSREMHNFALGSYTVDAVITYGSANSTMVGSTKFSVFPWHFLLVLVIVIALVIFLLVWGIRSYNRMIIKRAQGSSRSSAPKG